MAQPQITPFKISAEDLRGLDSKTRAALQPLLDALNVSFQQTVAAISAAPDDELVTVTLVTQDTVAASFPLRFKTSISQPRFVALAVQPRSPNHVLTTPFVMQGFTITDAGLISVPSITGLLPLNTYDLTFLVR